MIAEYFRPVRLNLRRHHIILDLVFEVDISFTKLLLNYHQGSTQSRASGRRVRGTQPPGKFLRNQSNLDPLRAILALKFTLIYYIIDILNLDN